MKFPKQQWGPYKIQAKRADTDIRDAYPLFLPLYLLPYFWDSDIYFDIRITPNRKLVGYDDTWQYEWELCDTDEKPIKPKQYGTIQIPQGKIRKHFQFTKKHAIALGYLPPNRYYLVYATFTNSNGENSGRILIATFTTKDRGELYTQLFISLVVILAGIIIGFIFKGVVTS